MARTRTNRRIAKAGGQSAASDLTIREVLFVRLVMETAKYLEMKAIPFGAENSGQEKVQRGIVRGMALAMTKMYGNGYEPYWTREIKDAEKAAARIAKEWISDGRSENGDWWFRRRRQFWRSASDAAQA